MSLDGAPRSASVITVEPTTCAVVNRAQFRDFILAHPDFAMHLIERLIHRVRVTTGNLKSLALSDVYGRVVRLLYALAKEVDGRQIVPEKLTQQEIADRVGASRDMIGKLMKDLVAGGYLAVEDRTITILKKLPTGW
jgi:CRP/FNR family cyclic AMP-dependent transcriptional regulator